MNSLSWMIYAAGVVGDLKALFVLMGVFVSLGVLVYSIHMGMEADFGDAPKGSWMSPMKKMWIPFCFILIAVFIPKESTIYMVAASEAGEQVINTPEAREMFDVLRQRIMEELKVEPK